MFSWTYPRVERRNVTEMNPGSRCLLYFKVIYFYFIESSRQRILESLGRWKAKGNLV